MADWARSQGIDPVVVLSDENGGSVAITEIKQAIKGIVDAATTDQLLVYFAGHGVNIRYGEYWLLSDAPSDTQAAVNVSGSATLAAYCGIPYVVFVSDACRTAAEGIQAQFVTGSEIFPNNGVGGPEKPVDRFYACLLGAPANEIRDPAVAASEYSALYTGALLDALDGLFSRALDWRDEGGKRVGYVRPRPLKRLLPSELARRLREKGLGAVIQVPDAHVASDDDAWISRCEAAHGDAPTMPEPEAPPSAPSEPLPPAPAPAAPADEPGTPLAELLPVSVSTATALLRPALAGDLMRFEDMLRRTETRTRREAAGFEESVLRVREPFGLTHHETECGFKVRGAKFADAFSPRAVIASTGTDVSVAVAGPGASVLLVFGNRCGTLLPAIPGFIAALTVEGDELVDVAYEPSDNNWRWYEFSNRADKARSLHAVIARSAREGVFRLEGEDAEQIAREMQSVKSFDPTLAIYAAYAYQDLLLSRRIAEMAGFLRRDLNAVLFDVAMLGRELNGKQAGTDSSVLSFVPLLGQGWALLHAFQISLPNELDGIERTLKSSLWTTFDEKGIAKIRAALLAGALG
jgi:hypothetical protein